MDATRIDPMDATMEESRPRTLPRTAAALLLALAAVSSLGALGLATLPAAAQVTRVGDLEFPPLPPFDIPQPQRVELDNGMVILLLEDHELPLVDATALIATGSRLEPADQVGLAELTGTVLRTGGTTTRSGDELDDYLEGKAAVIETAIGTESGRASMSCLVEDLDEVLTVFADVLRNPIFAEDKIQVAKTSMEASIARQNDNPQSILFRELREIVYGAESPYARDVTYESLSHIDRESLVTWHRRYFHPNRIILGLVGDFDTASMVIELRRVFGDWKPGPPPEDAEVPLDTEPHPGVFYVEKNDMTQSNIAMGHLGIRRDDPDYYSVEVMNQVLSGSFASRMFSRIRTEKGLAYTVFGFVGSSWDHRGLAFLGMTTKTETTGAGIEALLTEARNMVTEPPTPEEVAKAKAGILNSFIFRSDSRSKILTQQLTFEYYGYPLDWLARYRAGIEAVTTDEVRRAAEKHLHPEQLSIVVVGPAEGRDKPLSTYGPVTEVDITIPEPPAENVEVTEEGAARAADLLALASQSLGGGDLDSIGTLQLVGKAVLQSPQGPMEAQVTSTLRYPGDYRQELTLPFGRVAMVITPEAAFIESPQGVMEMPDSQRKSTESSLRRSLLWLLRARSEPGFTATVAGQDQVAGTPVELVQLALQGEVTTLAIEPESGRLLQLRYRGPGPAGAPGDVVQTYSDFRPVEGLTYPFSTATTFNGEESLAVTLDEVRVNPPLEEGLFTPPAADE